jgi:hypothetical protein
MRDELLNEALFFSLDHARQKLAAWVDDYDTTRLRWRRKFGQLAKLGSTSLKDGLYDWEAEAVLC